MTDIESGYKREVSKEYWEGFMKMWGSFMPKIDSSKSVITVFGTGGDMEGREDFKDIFVKDL